jgi:hypothetical protein
MKQNLMKRYCAVTDRINLKITRRYQDVCDRLNNILDSKPDDFIDQVNDIIYREVYQKGGDLYINRQLYIENGFDTDKAKKLIKTETDKVMFIPSDDPTEHPGITFIYKPEFRRDI